MVRTEQRKEEMPSDTLDPFRIDEIESPQKLFHYEAMLACKIRLVCALLQESLAAEPEA